MTIPAGFHESADGSIRCNLCHLHSDQCNCIGNKFGELAAKVGRQAVAFEMAVGFLNQSMAMTPNPAFDETIAVSLGRAHAKAVYTAEMIEKILACRAVAVKRLALMDGENANAG